MSEKENKVVILAPLPPPSGGIASWAARMMKTQLKNGWKVEIIDEKLIGRSSHGDNNKKRLSVEAKRCLKIWNNLRKALNDKNTKVVHACTAATTTGMLRDSISALITHIKGRKYIIHFRCTIPNLMAGRFKRFIFRVLCNSSDLVMTLNKQSQNYVEENTKTKAVLVPNFADDSAVEKGKNREYNDTFCTVLYTGGVTEEKGCVEIIEAARSFPNISFRLVGNIREEIKHSNIPANVILTGVKTRQEVDKEIDSADAYIFFTHMDSEGFANSLVEAMAGGLPCIVTDWAANKDMIEGKGGLVLNIHDVEGLKKAISTFEKDAVLRKECGIWNVEKVRTSYSEKVVTAQYVDIYESLM